jgi:microcystin-dependent protein
VIPEGVKVPVGTILETLRDTAPTGYALMQGQTLTNAETALPLLWAALPATFKSGSDIVLPNLQGRVTVMAGSGPGLTARALGASGGTEAETLTVAQMPVHTHTQNAHSHGMTHGHTGIEHNHTQNPHTHTTPNLRVEQFGTGTLGLTLSGGAAEPLNLTGTNLTNATATNQAQTAGVNNFVGNTGGITATNNNAGSGNAHNNMQPFVVVNKMIRIE